MRHLQQRLLRLPLRLPTHALRAHAQAAARAHAPEAARAQTVAVRALRAPRASLTLR